MKQLVLLDSTEYMHSTFSPYHFLNLPPSCAFMICHPQTYYLPFRNFASPSPWLSVLYSVVHSNVAKQLDYVILLFTSS